MPRYRIGFYNRITDSTGYEHRVCQREEEVLTEGGEAEAISDGILWFEKREGISNWKGRAQEIECTRLDEAEQGEWKC